VNNNLAKLGVYKISHCQRLVFSKLNYLPMKTYFATLFILSVSCQSISAQVRYTATASRNYSEWFKQYSQTPDFKLAGAELLAFVKDAPVRTAPLLKAKIKGQLEPGQRVKNLTTSTMDITYATQNGYRDQWLLVEACDNASNSYTGYVWGGHLAKSWCYFDLEGDGEQELIALGLSDRQRQAPEDIRASLKIIRHAQVSEAIELEGICLFEDCGASSLLRVFDFGTTQRTTLFEATIFSKGCLSGIDKALVAWDGQQLQLIHRAEYTTGHTYASNPLYLRQPTQTQICYYKSENSQYDPVWNCRTLEEGVAVP
jgi:hypothetical protein